MMNFILYISPALILLIISSVLFTESVESLGKSMKFSHSFTGAIISPLFTSAPELIVILLSITIVGGTQGSDIAAGTIIGEPFMVSSLGFFALSLSFLIGRNKFKNTLPDKIFSRTFLILSLTLPLMLIPAYFHLFIVRVLTVILLIVIYIIVLNYYHSNGTNVSHDEGKDKPIRIIIKLIVGLAAMIIGSDLLINAINFVSISLKIDAEIISILIIPIGTIMPETMNSVLWSYKGKINLALGALIGEELLFSTFYPLIGISLTSWSIDFQGTIAIFSTSVYSLIAGILMLKRKGWQWPLLFSFLVLIGFLFLIVY